MSPVRLLYTELNQINCYPWIILHVHYDPWTPTSGSMGMLTNNINRITKTEAGPSTTNNSSMSRSRNCSIPMEQLCRKCFRRSRSVAVSTFSKRMRQIEETLKQQNRMIDNIAKHDDQVFRSIICSFFVTMVHVICDVAGV